MCSPTSRRKTRPARCSSNWTCYVRSASARLKSCTRTSALRPSALSAEGLGEEDRLQAEMVERRKLLGRIVVLAAAVIALSLGLSGEERPLRDASERMSYLDNGIIKVGVDL